MFLSDIDCVREIEQCFPSLIDHFMRESDGSYKADTCRLAALYNHGGYYFDIDLDVVEAYIPEDTVLFVTAEDFTNTYFFQAVLFASKKNNIIQKALETEIDYYEGRLQLQKYRLKGPTTLQ